MKIAQVVLPGLSAFEAKCQRIDLAALSTAHEISVVPSPRDAIGADVAHVYGPTPLPAHELIGFNVPYVASSAPVVPRFAFRKPAWPRALIGPMENTRTATNSEVSALVFHHVPEAVEASFFAHDVSPKGIGIGSFARPSIRNIMEQTLVRISRFRGDVSWTIFDQPPSRADLAGVEVWVDPAVHEDDLDGFVAEAIAAGLGVVASRTQMNATRLEEGRTGFLVPVNDPNELTHAILAALFKPEVARTKIEAARQTVGKFRPRQRSRVLDRIYKTLIP